MTTPNPDTKPLVRLHSITTLDQCTFELTFLVVDRDEAQRALEASAIGQDLRFESISVAGQIQLKLGTNPTFSPSGDLADFYDLLHNHSDSDGLSEAHQRSWFIATTVDEIIAWICRAGWLRAWPGEKGFDHVTIPEEPSVEGPVYNLRAIFGDDED